MRALKERVAGLMKTLLPADARVLVALSGGPDSVALSLLLRDAQPIAGFTLAGVAHFNHLLRGAESDGDEAFCREFAASIGVPFVSERADVAAIARTSKRSIEDTARRLRYGFLERARSELGAEFIAVAHTRDDQAETYLLRLVRGSGARGLSGMRTLRGRIVRPLLDIGRDEVHAMLHARQVPFRTDETNLDVSFPRNRVRHEVLPALARVSPAATRSIARAARFASDDEDFLERRAIEVLPMIVLSEEEAELRLDLSSLAQLDPAIGRRVVRHALEKLASARSCSAVHIEAVWRLRSGHLDLPGMMAEAESGRLILRRTAARADRRSKTNVFCYPLSIPGEVRIGEAGVSISAEIVIGRAGQTDKPTDEVFVTGSSAATGSGLFVRNRRPGDRFRPLGMTGRRKLQDFMVDRKVPRSERDSVPLVVNAEDRIVWVVGHTVAEDFKVTDPGQAVLLLKVKYLGGTV
jgi:tRNA(Ile)-lysidine synthase